MSKGVTKVNKKSGSKVDVFTLVFFLHIFVAFVLVTLTKLGQESLVIVLTSVSIFLVGFVIRSNKANKLDKLKCDLEKEFDHNSLESSGAFKNLGDLEKHHQLLPSNGLKGTPYTARDADWVIEKCRNDLYKRMAKSLYTLEEQSK